MKKKIALILAVVMLLAVAVVGTIAWLTDSTQTITNTFTVGDIEITLTENTTTYKMIPGATIAKDPKVTVVKDSEACWLFVEITESADLDRYIEYEMADGWISLGTAYPNVYYRAVAATTAAPEEFPVLNNDQVTVLSSVNADMLEAVETDADMVTLAFTAYAIQSENLAYGNAADDTAKAVIAWGELNG